LKKIVEESYLRETGSAVVGKVYGGRDIFASTKNIYEVFQVDIMMRKMFGVVRGVRRGSGISSGSRQNSRHIVDSFIG
jgi:hypothetical protein